MYIYGEYQNLGLSTFPARPGTSYLKEELQIVLLVTIIQQFFMTQPCGYLGV
jgi:hypothetical protein